MPEIRAQLGAELHRKLKAEAAQRGIPLKELVAKILEEYMTQHEKKGKGGKNR